MVGYTRVSTERQAEQGESLDAQADLLRQYAVEHRFDLPLIFQDAASASGASSFLRRGDLRAAVIEARERGVPLLVARIDRLARDTSALRHPDVSGIEIYSVANGGRVTRKQLRNAIREAQREAEDISRRAQKDWRDTAMNGRRRRLSGPTKEHRRSGTISNMLRADQKVRDLADFLERNPDWNHARTKSLAGHLNESGLWNLVSERDSVRKPWTENSLRKPLKKARELLALQAEDVNDDNLFLGFDRVDLIDERPPAETFPSGPAMESHEKGRDAADASDTEDYKRDPGFGIF